MRNKGFTLIELMIVVAIIGILSMIAMPSYQDYTKRTYVSEGLALASGVKLSVIDVFSTTGKWPRNNAEAGLPAANKISGQGTQGIAVAAGLNHTGGVAVEGDASDIVIYYNEKVMGQLYPDPAPSDPEQPGHSGYVNTLTLSPVLNAGSISWICSARGFTLYSRWLPANCRATLPY